ncbi:hypothetical protein FKW77_001337 [Venturia effusa]|uniref:Uncharacterized protein n=1 Tax=Venturia effusa TaxID=50376 RepID=A0A517KZ04_9PEZI|nr:hypothetical protein FKW77_001337 [Venturia effusa]
MSIISLKMSLSAVHERGNSRILYSTTRLSLSRLQLQYGDKSKFSTVIVMRYSLPWNGHWTATDDCLEQVFEDVKAALGRKDDEFVFRDVAATCGQYITIIVLKFAHCVPVVGRDSVQVGLMGGHIAGDVVWKCMGALATTVVGSA